MQPIPASDLGAALACSSAPTKASPGATTHPAAPPPLHSTAAATASRDRFTRQLMVCLWCQFGFFYGMSPLVLPVAEAFGDVRSAQGGAFLFGAGIMLALINVVSGASILFLPLTAARCRRAAAAGMWAWLGGIALQALAVRQRLMAPFLLSFVLLGGGMGVFNLYLHVTLTRVFWAHDVARAHATAGFWIGFGAIVHALLFGVLSDAVGVVETLAAVGGLHAALLAHAWRAGFRHLDFYGGGGGERGQSETAATPALALLRTWKMVGVLFVFAAFMFCGMAMKMLLSAVFEQTLAMTHLQSTYYSALCLCFYWLCRAVSPLLGREDRVLTLFFWVLLLECVAYALTPLAIAAQRSWLFTLFRILSGGGFATLTSNITPLVARMFGLADLHNAIAVASWFEPLAGTGAAVAWLMHVGHEGAVTESYDLFFRLCSATVGVAAVVVAALAHWTNREPSADARPQGQHCQQRSGGNEAIAQA
jgi:hypothetical protein